MDALLKLLVAATCLGALGYCVRAFRIGRVNVKGVTYTLERPAAFAFGVGLIATFAVMLLGLVFAYEYMQSTLQLGVLTLMGGMAILARVMAILFVLFLASLALARWRAGESGF